MCERLWRSAAATFLILFLLSSLNAQSGSKERRDNPTPADYALLEASAKGDVAGVQKALDEGAFVDTPTYTQRRTPLMYAAGVGSAAVVRLLLANKADPNLKSSSGETALTFADRGKYTEVVAILKNAMIRKALSGGVDMRVSQDIIDLARRIDAQQQKRAVPKSPQRTESQRAADRSLLAACLKGDLTAAQAAIDAGANVNAQDEEGMTPLMRAAERANWELIDLVVKHGPNFAIQDDHGRTASNVLGYYVKDSNDKARITSVKATWAELQAASDKKAQELVDALIARDTAKAVGLAKDGAYPDYIDRRTTSKVTPLILAASLGNTQVLELLIGSGARIERTDISPYHRTALFHAIEHKQFAAARLLIAHGANVSPRDVDGSTPFLRAAYFGNVEGLKLLLENKVDVNEVNTSNKDSALHEAIEGRHPEVVPILLEAGANPNLQNRDGATPLMRAVLWDDRTSIGLLLNKGADLSLKSKDGKTALDIARDRRDAGVIAALSRPAMQPTKPKAAANDVNKPAVSAAESEARPTTSPRPTPTPAPPNADSKHTKPEDVAAMFKALTEWQTNTSMNAVRLINLMRGGLDPNVRDSSGRTPLVYAAAIKEPYAALTWLLKSGADINAQTTGEGTTALMEAVARKNAMAVVHLAGAAAKTDIKDKKGRTALDIAKEVNDPVVLIFSDMLWNPFEDYKTAQSMALFRMVSYRKDQANRAKVSYELMSDLIKLVGNNDARDLFGRTPLMYAAANGDDTMMTLLILNSAAVNAQSDDGTTALMEAVLGDQLMCAITLLQNGARKDIRDKKGRTAYDIAVAKKGQIATMMLSDLK